MLPEPAEGVTEIAPNFGYVTHDIDSDGYGEIFVMYRNRGFCGDDGCRLVGYRFDGKQWSAFLDAYAMDLGVKPAETEGSFGEVALIGERTQFLRWDRSEEHTSELQSLMRHSYAVFCLKQKNNKTTADDYNDAEV